MLFLFVVLSLIFAAVLVQGTVSFVSLRALWVFPLAAVGAFLALLLLFLLVFLVAGLLADPNRPQEKASRFHRFLLCQFSRIALTLGGAHLHVTGLEKLPKDGRFLLVSNHNSIFDPVLFYNVMPRAELAFIAKKEAFGYFLVGGYLRKTLGLPVDRENDREALKSILQAIQNIREDKVSYAIFPEGKCNETGELLLPYRSGAFKIAQKTGIPIVICCIAGTRYIKKQMFRKRTDLYLDVLDVIPAGEVIGHTTVELAARTHPVMLAGLEAQKEHF